MKKNFFRSFTITATLVLLMFLSMPVLSGSAASKPRYPSKLAMTYSPVHTTINQSYIGYSFYVPGMRVFNVKSSNPSVIKAKRAYDSCSVNVLAKRSGSSTVSFKLKIGSRTYKYKCRVRAYPYKNPFRSLKVGKREFASWYSETSAEYLDDTKSDRPLKGKVSIKLNKNWKIAELAIRNTKKWTSTKVQRGQKIRLTNNNNLLFIHVKNRKTGEGMVINL